MGETPCAALDLTLVTNRCGTTSAAASLAGEPGFEQGERDSMRRILMLAVVLMLGLVGLAPAAAENGGVDLEGEINGAAFEIRVPEHWNGTLVMYAHGYRDKADGPGEVDDTSAQAFIADPFEDVMLAAGYAVAGSAYRDNGWAVREGIADTRNLVRYFHHAVGVPQTTLLVGLSMGSVVTFESIEIHDGLYDGAIPACAVGAGTPRAFDGTLAVMAAYDAVYGMPAAWGTPGDVRDDLDFDAEVAPVLFGRLLAPDGPAKFEFIRLVTGVPSGPEWPFSPFYLATEGWAELERRAGGAVAQNADHTYVVSPDDRAYLGALGMDDATIDGYLGHMDGSRWDAPSTRSYVQRYADYTGRLQRPVLTLGTAVDALVPPSHISKYNDTVAAAGSSSYVVNAYTDGVGHCNFTPAQMLSAVDALQGWVDTGVAPDASAFPAAEGFIDLTPQQWPQP